LTVLVTGASVDGIAAWITRHLLCGGARVIATSSELTNARIAGFRQLYAESAGPGSELHLLPFNQGSSQDVEQLIEWLAEAPPGREDGSKSLLPDILIPFAAPRELGTLDQLGADAQRALDVMLLGVERLIVAVAAAHRKRGVGSTAHVLVPLSPNHGSFGGDGLYAECKVALEALTGKWHSEFTAWARHVTLCPVRIGWVRGTGLMKELDELAAWVERESGCLTFSAAEMGFLLAGLCVESARLAARAQPLEVDLTAGLSEVRGLNEILGRARELSAARKRAAQGAQRLASRLLEALPPRPTNQVAPLPHWPVSVVETRAPDDAPLIPSGNRELSQMVVIVGFDELGPCGNARTRFELEANGELSPGAVLELAWITGLIVCEPAGSGHWIEVATGASVDETEIVERFREAVLERVGIREIAPASAGFDPRAVPVLATAYLDHDLTVSVSSRREAEAYRAAAPDHTLISYDSKAHQWWVVRKAGAPVRIAKLLELTRKVAGLVPLGFDFRRCGVPAEMVDRVDRVSLFNLVATVEAFTSAGLTPEELLRHLHPTRVGNSQGTGLGGTQSLSRMMVDPLLENERQNDILQETLANVVASYVVQSYVGAYGSMTNPTAACATAAVSVELGVQQLLADKADFVVAGGVDDLTAQASLAFADMNATANSDELVARGMQPQEMSRPNDERRAGFIEAHGAGAMLLTRGDIALRLGLHVYGVVAY
ncbi:MAG TPA: beta-ketoacyl synthase N-terminal-like domain-containing protein, partial [Polyangiaceae bacterium]